MTLTRHELHSAFHKDKARAEMEHKHIVSLTENLIQLTSPLLLKTRAFKTYVHLVFYSGAAIL
jgi:hypothetical protein